MRPAMSVRNLLEAIAIKHLRIPTLSARHSDGLDFHVLAVWSIRKALHAAYLAGVRAEQSRTKP